MLVLVQYGIFNPLYNIYIKFRIFGINNKVYHILGSTSPTKIF